MDIYKLFTIAQLLTQLIFVSVSLVRENFRGLRVNLKTQNLNLGDVSQFHRENLPLLNNVCKRMTLFWACHGTSYHELIL